MSKFILADVSEQRHFHESLLEYANFAPGIEELTGCDFIITPLEIPYSNDSFIRRHCKAGLCVQRKDIGDFAASITSDDSRLWTQLMRMCKVTDMPWLLIIGDLKGNKEGKAVIDGRESEWTYTALIAAMEYWQLRGDRENNVSGRYTWLNRDSQVVGWCKNWHNRLVAINENDNAWPDRKVWRPVPQSLYPTSDIERTLATFPTVGFERASAIYQRARELNGTTPPSLVDCAIVVEDEKVEGVGKATRKKFLTHMYGEKWTDGTNETGESN